MLWPEIISSLEMENPMADFSAFAVTMECLILKDDERGVVQRFSDDRLSHSEIIRGFLLCAI